MVNYIFAPPPTFGISEHPFTTWNDAFTFDELRNIINYCDSIPKNKGSVGGSSENDDISNIRKSDIAWIDLNDTTKWIYDRLADVLRSINGQFYRFDIYGFCENLQYTLYDGNYSGHYTWHQDSGVSHQFSSPRKLSLVLQLSDSWEYEGGELEIYSSLKPTQVKKQKGLITVFPSYMLHRVTPVTAGIRRTLVVWVTGPAFR